MHGNNLYIIQIFQEKQEVKMVNIAFIDLEIDDKNQKIVDIGVIYGSQCIHHNHLVKIISLIQPAEFLCGHNFLHHDFSYLKNELAIIGKTQQHIIDTLLLSPLLFPARPYHALNKDYKTALEESNNPLNDCRITQDLLDSEIQAFLVLPRNIQMIFYQLLSQQVGFSAFFQVIHFQAACEALPQLIAQTFATHICGNAPLIQMIEESPIELAYALALINSHSRYSITPAWLQYQYPKIESIFKKLRNTPCSSNCFYCQTYLSATAGLQKYFGFSAFRQYDDQPLQQQAAEAAIAQQSLLAIFPTGGGKSVTFQVPALIAGESSKALTVVISPLQSLMQDQVDNLEQKGISEAVTINGLLDPIERQKALERVQDGSASLLYISPESLRSRTIEKLLLKRYIARFVIDEAHCFSAWGQDFRVDYLYIGEFIRNLKNQKRQPENIPISCFTATAKPQVIDDICQYFKRELNLDLSIFAAKVGRKNLHYKVLAQKDEEEKYQTLRRLIEQHNCPTIVYVSRTKRTKMLSEYLVRDGFRALPYYGKMDADNKIANQNAFKTDEAQIMVATSAFGMGVDKNNVGLVVHYDVPDSLENYVQEAGRAGRDEQIQAACYILFNGNEDLDKHFTLLNQTKISITEIKQIWKAIKQLCGSRQKISESALEIAREAGWIDLRADEIETRVKTAIAALEDVGYIKRGQNMPRVFATSILSKNADEAIEKIQKSSMIYPDEKQNAIRIVKKLFSQKSQVMTDEDGESRVDYLADVLGLKTERVVRIVTWLREEKILADQQDLCVFIRQTTREGDIIASLNKILKVETALLAAWHESEASWSLKQLNQAVQQHFQAANPKQIKSLLNFWKIKNWLGRDDDIHHSDSVGLVLRQSVEDLRQLLARKAELAEFVVRYLSQLPRNLDNTSSDLSEVNFSIGELKQAFNNSSFQAATLDEIEDTLFYLSRMGILKIEGGFLVLYQRLSITRLQSSNSKNYTNADYQKLANYYETRKQQIHIVGKYVQLMLADFQAALKMVEDYFSLEYNQFLRQYFTQSERHAMKRNMTATRFEQWFGSLSSQQAEIIQDDKNQYIVVFAAPGSGKTRTLVHKLASLYQMEDVKHEQLLMLTFSRAAAHEFKSRLFDIMGNAAAYVEIKTFHSYCFDLLGRVGDLSEAKNVIQQAIDKINTGEVENSRIAKSVLVIDEAQDINATQFELIKTLIKHNDEMRVIAVGDDDQTIYDFMKASPDYMRQLLTDFGAKSYDLLENYRSQPEIVAFCNGFAKHIEQRLKTEDIVAVQQGKGEILWVDFSGCVLPYLLEQVRLAYDESRSVAILTQTNEEAIWLAGQLNQCFIPCKLVQNNQGFQLNDLLEVSVFEHFLNINNEQSIIQAAQWEYAKNRAYQHFSGSKHLSLLKNVIESFEQAHPERKYVSDWRIFVQESRLEDFYHAEKGVVLVSTIHKAKGREFDHVFVYIDKKCIYGEINDVKKREFYVACSRAKWRLTVFSNSRELQQLFNPTEYGKCVYYESETQQDARELALYLGHKDVNLGKFHELQEMIRLHKAGDELAVMYSGCLNGYGQEILGFSKKFKNKLMQYYQKGYRLQGAEVNFVVRWQDKNDGRIARIVLPIVYLEK